MNICVFCSSKSDLEPSVFDQAKLFSKKLVENGDSFVYGGGAEGLMGFFADEVLSLGGKAFGVMPEKTFPQEAAHKGLTELHYTRDMLDRKRLMMELSEAFVIFPGGIGTIDEALEVITWKTVYKDINKPVVFFNWNGFWDPFFEMLKKFEKTNLFYPETMKSFKSVNSVEDVLKECYAKR